MFTFNDVPEVTSNFKPTIEPGISEVIILGYDSKTEENYPHVQLKFSNLEGTREVFIKLGTNAEINPGKSVSSLTVSLKNLRHIASACLNDAEKEAITASSQELFLYKVLDAIKGKKLRMKFTGRQYYDKAGAIKVATEIGYPNFAENISIPREQTILRFDPNNSYDFKKVIEPATGDKESTATLW